MAEVNSSKGLGPITKSPKHKIVQRRQESARPDDRNKGGTTDKREKKPKKAIESANSDGQVKQAVDKRGKKVDIQA
jgi:hypothetical protein